MENLLTIGQLQSHFGVSRAVLDHAVRTYGPEPVGRIAVARVWPREQLCAISESLQASASRRTRQNLQSPVA